MVGERTCARCRKTKSRHHFDGRGRQSNGVKANHWTCKKCVSEQPLKTPGMTKAEVRGLRKQLREQWEHYDVPPGWKPIPNEVCSFKEVLGPDVYGWTDREDMVRKYSPDGEPVLVTFAARRSKIKPIERSTHVGVKRIARKFVDGSTGSDWGVVLQVNGEQKYLYRSKHQVAAIGWLHQLAEDCGVQVPPTACIYRNRTCEEYRKNV